MSKNSKSFIMPVTFSAASKESLRLLRFSMPQVQMWRFLNVLSAVPCEQVPKRMMSINTLYSLFLEHTGIAPAEVTRRQFGNAVHFGVACKMLRFTIKNPGHGLPMMCKGIDEEIVRRCLAKDRGRDMVAPSEGSTIVHTWRSRFKNLWSHKTA